MKKLSLFWVLSTVLSFSCSAQTYLLEKPGSYFFHLSDMLRLTHHHPVTADFLNYLVSIGDAELYLDNGRKNEQLLHFYGTNGRLRYTYPKELLFADLTSAGFDFFDKNILIIGGSDQSGTRKSFVYTVTGNANGSMVFTPIVQEKKYVQSLLKPLLPRVNDRYVAYTYITNEMYATEITVLTRDGRRVEGLDEAVGGRRITYLGLDERDRLYLADTSGELRVFQLRDRTVTASAAIRGESGEKFLGFDRFGQLVSYHRESNAVFVYSNGADGRIARRHIGLTGAGAARFDLVSRYFVFLETGTGRVGSIDLSPESSSRQVYLSLPDAVKIYNLTGDFLALEGAASMAFVKARSDGAGLELFSSIRKTSGYNYSTLDVSSTLLMLNYENSVFRVYRTATPEREVAEIRMAPDLFLSRTLVKDNLLVVSVTDEVEK